MPPRTLIAHIPMPLITLGAIAAIIAAAIYLGLAAGFGLPPFAASETTSVNLEILLDRSVAMSEPLEGGARKLDAAIQAIQQNVLSTGPGPNLDNMAFRQYGGPCGGDNTRLVVGFGPENRQDIGRALQDLTADGETTFVDGMVQAIRDFGQASTTPSTHNEIIVIAGGSDTCQLEEAAPRLRQEIDQLGVPVRIRFIGLDVPADQREQLDATALSISGVLPLYVSSSIELAAALTELMARGGTVAEGPRPGENLVQGSETPVVRPTAAPLSTPTPALDSSRDGPDSDAPQQLLVVKSVINDNGGTAVPTDFTVTVVGSNPIPATFPGDSNGTMVTMGAGNYHVSEIGPAGYEQSLSTTCSGALSPGQSATCTLTSDDVAPTLTVVKEIVNDHGGASTEADFTLRINGDPVSSGQATTLNAGAHVVSEDPVADYTASISGDCDAGGNVTLAPGDNLSCIITNDDNPPVDLSLSMMVLDTTLAEQDTFSYVLTVTNNGPGEATGIAVTNILPGGISFDSADGAYDPTTGIWMVGDLPAPNLNTPTATLNIQAVVDTGAGGAIITNTAEITSAALADPDSIPGNSNPAEDDQASVSVTVGTLIAFVSERDGNAEIYVMGADGSNQARLTVNDGADILPDWSPDGRRIAFASSRDGDLEIFIMDIDSSNQTAITMNAANDASPSWSPDGSQIAFASGRDGNFEVYVMNADGSNPVRLTNNSAADLNPSWSPDGSQITFATDRDGNFEVYAMDADGSNQTNLTNHSSADTLPDWSPDGSRITFASNRDGNGEIYVMDPDGFDPVRLTTSTGDDFYAEWSADSSMITFRSARDGNLEIYTMAADGSNQTRLTSDPDSDYHPVWLPGPGSW